ncbi:uncharacterized protein IUM83_12622 [Phytophthora cinnamomi]|uniref:uncharacterized protein n=1 Tax=Phytophthora cinnamomi TaxID=4785 RepID=UPI00355A69D9|nr:hypothetical protein IUM83_12622 [Phytophthora cinnamomi]
MHEHLERSGETHWLTILLVAQWCLVLPFYLATTPLQCESEELIYHVILDELAMSLYFHWPSATAFFAVIDVVQSYHSAYFSFQVYTYLLVVLLALVVRVHDSNHDPTVAISAAWVLHGLICSPKQFEGEMLETVETLQDIAVAVVAVFTLMVFGDLLWSLFE